MNKNVKILIDNGHGFNTPGKCSPDKRLMEYKYCREIAERLAARLREAGYDAERIVTEQHDVGLHERVARVNAHCKRHGASRTLLLSIHNNAAPPVDGKWHNATGWSVWVCRNASQQARKLAQALYCEAEKRSLKGNRAVPKQKYWQADFYILKHTLCPAVLTENMFQDNKADVEYLLSPQGREAIVQLHLDALKALY